MRVMLKAEMDVEAANRAIHDGTMPRMMQEVMGQLQPEAAYFGPHNGKRTAFIVFDLKDLSDLPVITEPFFESAGASVEVFPVMNRDDLAAGLERLAGGATAGMPGD